MRNNRKLSFSRKEELTIFTPAALIQVEFLSFATSLVVGNNYLQSQIHYQMTCFMPVSEQLICTWNCIQVPKAITTITCQSQQQAAEAGCMTRNKLLSMPLRTHPEQWVMALKLSSSIQRQDSAVLQLPVVKLPLHRRKGWSLAGVVWERWSSAALSGGTMQNASFHFIAAWRGKNCQPAALERSTTSKSGNSVSGDVLNIAHLLPLLSSAVTSASASLESTFSASWH